MHEFQRIYKSVREGKKAEREEDGMLLLFIPSGFIPASFRPFPTSEHKCYTKYVITSKIRGKHVSCTIGTSSYQRLALCRDWGWERRFAHGRYRGPWWYNNACRFVFLYSRTIRFLIFGSILEMLSGCCIKMSKE